MKQTLKYIYERLYEQIKYAEAKHSVSIALASALTVFSATYLNNSLTVVTVLSAISIIFSLISVIYSFLALSVHNFSTKRNRANKRTNNYLYYRNIARFDEKTYLDEIMKNYPFLKGYKPDAFDYDLANQVITTSKAISQKFTFFNFAITFLLFSLLTEAGAIVILGLK